MRSQSGPPPHGSLTWSAPPLRKRPRQRFQTQAWQGGVGAACPGTSLPSGCPCEPPGRIVGRPGAAREQTQPSPTCIDASYLRASPCRTSCVDVGGHFALASCWRWRGPRSPCHPSREPRATSVAGFRAPCAQKPVVAGRLTCLTTWFLCNVCDAADRVAWTKRILNVKPKQASAAGAHVVRSPRCLPSQTSRPWLCNLRKAAVGTASADAAGASVTIWTGAVPGASAPCPLYRAAPSTKPATRRPKWCTRTGASRCCGCTK